MKPTPVSKAEWIRTALDRYERPLLRYASRLLGNVEVAREVVQDTFLKLCQADQSRVDGHLAAWLYTVCRNRAFDVREKEGRMDPLATDHAETYRSPDPSPGAVAEGREMHGLVLDVLRTLPDNQQEAFRLKFQDNLNYREISQIMGVSLGTVSNLMAGAMDTLRTQLRSQVEPAREVQRHDA